MDTDCAWDLDNKRSLTGHLFTFNNYATNWKAQLQSIVALLTIEANYKANGSNKSLTSSF